jgi:hypothetical protein
VYGVGNGEVGEPYVEPLDPLGGKTREVSDQLVGITADQPRPQVAEPSGAHLADGVRIATGPGETDHLLDRNPGGSRFRGKLGQPVDVVRLQIPPIRVIPNEFHHPASAAT